MGRPVLRLRVIGKADEMLVTVDTGFNGELLLLEEEASKWGIAPLGAERDILLADGSIVASKQALTKIGWLGVEREVCVQLTELSKTPPPRTRREDDPSALIGTGLITPAILEINFGRGTVVIQNGQQP